MTKSHWAVFALRDIQNAIDKKRYEIAVHQIQDAIDTIIAIDGEDRVPTQNKTGRSVSQQ